MDGIAASRCLSTDARPRPAHDRLRARAERDCRRRRGGDGMVSLRLGGAAADDAELDAGPCLLARTAVACSTWGPGGLIVLCNRCLFDLSVASAGDAKATDAVHKSYGNGHQDDPHVLLLLPRPCAGAFLSQSRSSKSRKPLETHPLPHGWVF